MPGRWVDVAWWKPKLKGMWCVGENYASRDTLRWHTSLCDTPSYSSSHLSESESQMATSVNHYSVKRKIIVIMRLSCEIVPPAWASWVIWEQLCLRNRDRRELENPKLVLGYPKCLPLKSASRIVVKSAVPLRLNHSHGLTWKGHMSKPDFIEFKAIPYRVLSNNRGKATQKSLDILKDSLKIGRRTPRRTSSLFGKNFFECRSPPTNIFNKRRRLWRPICNVLTLEQLLWRYTHFQRMCESWSGEDSI